MECVGYRRNEPWRTPLQRLSTTWYQHQEALITQDVEQRIWRYIGGILHEYEMTALCIGGMPDHAYILQTIPGRCL